MSDYKPVVSDLQTVAANQVEAIDAAIRHERYTEAERLGADLIATLQQIQRLKFTEETSHETSV